eukprot:scaffold312087_cov15-Prasinocladus_malaysianus.AAC.1
MLIGNSLGHVAAAFQRQLRSGQDSGQAPTRSPQSPAGYQADTASTLSGRPKRGQQVATIACV